MSIWSTLPGLDADAPYGPPWLYRGSHVLPAGDHPRGGAVDPACIPSHITRDGRDDQPEDGAPWPWLRLAVDKPAVINPAQARHLARQLRDWANRAQRTHRDGQNAASGATETTGAPGADGKPNGPHAGTQDLEHVALRKAHLTLAEHAARLEHSLKDASDAVDRVHKLHVQCSDSITGDGYHCGHCNVEWPCPTEAAIDPADTRP